MIGYILSLEEKLQKLFLVIREKKCSLHIGRTGLTEKKRIKKESDQSRFIVDKKGKKTLNYHLIYIAG
jgi:hypothetical protein